MADIAKYAPINGNALISDFKTHFPILRAKRAITLAYGFVFVFIAFTIFLAFCPSSSSSSPWFTNIFTVTTTPSSPTSSSSLSSDQSYGSHFSSIFNYLFPNSSSSQPHNSSPTGSQDNQGFRDKGSSVFKNLTQNSDKGQVLKQNQTQSQGKVEVLKQNQTQSQGKVEVLKANQTTIGVTNSANKTVISSPISPSEVKKNVTAKVIAENSAVKNLTSSLVKKQSNESDAAAKVKQGFEDMIKSLSKCDLFDGNWVRDESYPLYKPGSCSLIDEQFNCFLNGRPDNGYLKLKWKPKGCSLPRLNGSHMLELLKGKRMVFVGDSLNRNMWESLICILRNSAKDQKKVYEKSGKHHFRTEPSYSFVFEDYKCTVEFFVSPFLVQEWEIPDKNGKKKETLRLDLVGRSADNYKDADIIVFNTGHWWTHDKTAKGKDYYQEGSHVYNELNVVEAFRKAITTWGRWVDANVDKMKSLVFFRGYSASHFSGGQWNSGGQCDHETEPIKNETYLSHYPPKMRVLEKVLRGMKTPVTYLNVTRMTDYRKDAHPSMYRKQHLSDEERRSPMSFQDCSHWCLPGVPDLWNEILYAELMVKLNQMHQSQN